MSISVREWLIQILANDFNKIKLANGYNYDVKNVYKNFVDVKSISDFPVIYFELVPDKADTKAFESRRFRNVNQQILIGAYVQYNENNPANINVVAEKIISDINNCIYGDDSNINTALKTFPSKISWDITNTDPYLDPKRSGIVEIRLMLEVDYLNSADVLQLLNTDLPDTPTITIPSNGSSVTTLFPQIDWDEISGALSYHIHLSSSGNALIDQQFINSNSFTIPYDSTLTNGSSYDVKIRAYNNVGYSDWSPLVSFTVNSIQIASKNPNEIGSCDLWLDSTTGVILTSGKVSTWNDRSGNSELALIL